MSRRLSAVLRDQQGVSAVEFGLLAPILVAAFLSAIDLGMAAYQRMALDSVLRTGAQRAMSDPGPSAVQQALLGAAAGAGGDASNASFAMPERFCACPTATSTPVACTSTCGGSSYTYIYYRLQGDSTFKGVLLSLNVTSRALVQIR